jgi:uncharacterized membrane protein
MAKNWIAIALALLFMIPPAAAVSGADSSEVQPAVISGLHRESLQFSMPITSFDGNFETVKVSGLESFLHQEGKPELPLSSVTYTYPVNTHVISVRLLDKQTGIVVLSGPVMPSLRPAMIGTDAPRPQLKPAPEPDRSVYSVDAQYPVDWLSTLATTGQDDSGKIVMFYTVYLYPVRYNPVRGTLLYLTEATLEIGYVSPVPEPQSRASRETYDTVVIAPNEFNATLQPYLTHKQNMGHVVKFVTLEQIYGSTFFPATGRDNQEKIKYFLKFAKENWTISYVVLVGDVEKLPWRACRVNDGADGTTTPSDYYYADFYRAGTLQFCSWDSNGNSVFGESGGGGANVDQCDLSADVTIGRIPAGSVAELTTLINKIKGYETAVPGQPWMNNVTLCGMDTFPASYGEMSGVAEGEVTLNVVAGYLSNFNITKLYESKGNLTTTNMKNVIDKGCLFASFSDHGNTDGVLYPAAGSGTYYSGTATSQVNGLKLPVALQDACLTTAFDGNDCLAECMVLNPNGGMITSAGCSRIGFGAWGNGYPFVNSGFIDTNFFEAYTNGKATPGKMLDAAKSNYLAEVGVNDYADFKTVIEYTLIGDPTILIGGPNLNATLPNNVSSIDPGSFMQYNISLSNSGKTKDQVNFTVTTSGANWTARTGSTLLWVDANSSVSVPLIVNCPQDSSAGSFSITDVKIISQNSGMSWDVHARTGTNRLYRVGLNVTDGTKLTDPNRTVSWNMVVTNKGNGPDVINMAANSLPSGWTYDLSRQSVPLEAFESACVTVSAGIPASARTGIYSFMVGIASTGEPVRNASSIVYARVNQVYGIQLELSHDSLKGAAGSELSSALRVTNFGNGLDTVELKVQDKPMDWTVALMKTEVRPDAFSSENVTFTLRTPAGALAGTYNISLNASSYGLPKSPVAGTLKVEIAAHYSYKMTVEETAFFVKAAGEQSVPIMLASDANAPDSFDFETEAPDGWKVAPGSKTVTADPFGEASNSVEVKVPADALAGTYTVTVRASSSGDPTLKETATLKFTVEPYYGLHSELKESLELMPGDEKVIKLTIYNDGNGQDSFLISPREPEGISCAFSNDKVLIPARGSAEVQITLKAPDDAAAGKYTLKLKVTSTGAPTCMTEHQALITVGQVFSIAAQGASFQATLFPEEATTFTFSVTNNGNGDDTLTIALEGGGAGWARLSSTSVALGRGESSSLTLTASPPKGTEKGAYALRVSVKSSDAVATPASLEFTVNVDKKPLIDLGGGSNQTALIGIGILAAIIVVAVVAVAASRSRRKKKVAGPASDSYGRVPDAQQGAEEYTPWSAPAPAMQMTEPAASASQLAVGEQGYSAYQFQAEKWVSNTTEASPAYEPAALSQGYGASDAQSASQVYEPMQSAPSYQLQSQAPPPQEMTTVSAQAPPAQMAPAVQAPAPAPVQYMQVAPPAPAVAQMAVTAPAPPPAAPAADSLEDIMRRLESLSK